MSQKVPEKQLPELDAKQVVALESLLQGSTATEAARAAGVNRRTLWRWQRADVEFQAALNRGRREAREAAQMRLEGLAGSAISTLEQAVAEGDVRAALAVLRGLSLLGGEAPSVGPDQPEAIALQARINRSRRVEEELFADLGFGQPTKRELL